MGRAFPLPWRPHIGAWVGVCKHASVKPQALGAATAQPRPARAGHPCHSEEQSDEAIQNVFECRCRVHRHRTAPPSSPTPPSEHFPKPSTKSVATTNSIPLLYQPTWNTPYPSLPPLPKIPHRIAASSRSPTTSRSFSTPSASSSPMAATSSTLSAKI